MSQENLSFSKETPRLQIAWDTVSTGLLKTCARKYFLMIVEGWQGRGVNPHLLFGLVCHSAREVYYNVMVQDKSHDEAVKKAILHCMEATGKRLDILECSSCGSRTDLEITSKNVCLKCNEDTLHIETAVYFPWHSDEPTKNLKTLIRTIVWYLDTYKDSDAKLVHLKDGSPACEIWFRFELPIKSPEDKPYILTGHIDSLVSYEGTTWFSDLKTTKAMIGSNFFKQFKPDNQIYQYAAGARIVFEEPVLGAMIDGAQVAVNFTKFERDIIQLTQAQIDEWLKDIQIWIKQAEAYAKADYWPMNDKSCHNYGGCEFRGICNKDPASRQNYLETNFEKRVWDPLRKRS